MTYLGFGNNTSSTSAQASSSFNGSATDIASNGLLRIQPILRNYEADPSAMEALAAMKEIRRQVSDRLVALEALDASLALSCFVFFQFVFLVYFLFKCC